MRLTKYNFWGLLFFWGFFVLYESFFSQVVTGRPTTVFGYTGYYLLHIGLFYFNTFFVLDKTLTDGKKAYFQLAGLLFFQFWAYMFLMFLLQGGPSFSITFFGPGTFTGLFHIGIYKFLLFCGFSACYWKLMQRGTKIDDFTKPHAQGLKKGENAIGPAVMVPQINPHFLFNTLNFLFNKLNGQSEKLAGVVLGLADMIRYSYHTPDPAHKISLSLEIDHVANYINLNQARFDHQLQIDFHQAGDPKDLNIVPGIIFTIVENVFNYGDLLDPAHVAKIDIIISQNDLTVTIENKKKLKSNPYTSGLGFAYIRKLLSTYYAGTHHLVKSETLKVYKLSLKIKL